MNINLIICILTILLYLIINKENFETINNDSKANDIKNILIDIIKKSNSDKIVPMISQNMIGSTMHHHYHILYDIRTLLGNEKKIYTEIGSYNGGSTSLMLHHNYETEINCIDPLHLERTNINILKQNITKFNEKNYKVNIYQKFSTDIKFINELKNKNFKTDILFIDGDHSYDTVLNDFYNFEQFVNPNGYIIFDDYEDYKDSPDVKIAVNKIVDEIDKNKYTIIGTLDNIKNVYDGLNLKVSNEFIIKKNDNKQKLLILLNCFFNYSDIERTVVSIKNNNYYDYDIIFLENPSKYSNKIKELAKKYNIYKHFICDKNIEGNIFTLFINKYSNIINNYKYIALSEADVVLDKGAVNEAISILDLNDDKVGNLSIDLYLNYEKYKNLPLDTWIKPPIIINNYNVGCTGFQFIIFKNKFLLEFIEKINKKELITSVALGIENYNGLSDSNLVLFNEIKKTLWIRTIKNKLDHIGWEHYIKNDDEYVQLKNENLKSKNIRNNSNINNYYLKLIE
jgi:predicted O-methyltransferase YrrM